MNEEKKNYEEVMKVWWNENKIKLIKVGDYEDRFWRGEVEIMKKLKWN